MTNASTSPLIVRFYFQQDVPYGRMWKDTTFSLRPPLTNSNASVTMEAISTRGHGTRSAVNACYDCYFGAIVTAHVSWGLSEIIYRVTKSGFTPKLLNEIPGLYEH